MVTLIIEILFLYRHQIRITTDIDSDATFTTQRNEEITGKEAQ
jgi:hypothetical protein